MIAKREHLARGEHDPTPREIRKRAAEIRRRWTPRQREKRRPSEPRWLPPTYPSRDLTDIDPDQN